MNLIIKPLPSFLYLVVFLCAVFGSATLHAAQYSLEAAVKRAQELDPWLQGSHYRQANLESHSISAGTLPDPSISLGVANLPVDSFNLSQEPMTQLKVSVSQMFPRGKTLSLRREALKNMAAMQPFARADRKAKVAETVSQLWLDVYLSKKTVALIERDRDLFEHLVDVAQSSYSSARGSTRQQDLIRAQLELTRLEDRLTMLRQHGDSQLARLAEWLSDSSYNLSIEGTTSLGVKNFNHPLLKVSDRQQKSQRLVRILSQHPKVQSIDQKIRAEASEIDLAKQSYKPQWGINASYAHRDDDPLGNEREDFFSVAVNVDLPLFTAQRQDKQVQAATAEHEAVKTERALVLRQLRSGFESAEANYRRLLDRRKLFNTRLLQEMSQQAEASLTAYTHDDGDFAEVVRARIAELNARIEALNVEVEIHKAIAQLKYYLITSAKDSNAFAAEASDND